MNVIAKWNLAMVVAAGLCACSVDPLLLASKRADAYDFSYTDSDLPVAMHIPASEWHEVELKSGDDAVPIVGVYVGDPSQVAVTDVIYYLHGNATDLAHYRDHITRLANVGGKYRYGIFAIDYRGFGKSEGELTIDNWIDDVNAGLQWLEDQGVTPDRLTVYGYSLGGVPAVMAAVDSESLQTRRLVLDAPFPGANGPLQGGTGLSIDGSFFSDIGDYDSIAEIAAYRGKLLWMHAHDDPTVPIEHGQAVYDACDCPKEASNPATGEHLVVDGLGLQAYLDLIDRFAQE